MSVTDTLSCQKKILLHCGRVLCILSLTLCRKEKSPDEDDFSLAAKTLHQGIPMMKIIHNYSLDDKTHPGYFLIISNEEHICSGCHCPMKCKDRRERIGRTFHGERSVYLIRRMYCRDCHIMHNELPDFLIKYKHFEVQIIEDTIDGNISVEDGYESPSEMTMYRWCLWFASIHAIIDSILCAIRAMLDDILPNLLGELSLTDAVRKQGEGWLITVFSVMINAGTYPRK